MPSETTHPLRKGFTTGVHAVAAFRMALEAFSATGERVMVVTDKMDNDDLDVTKGCEIVVTVSADKEDLHRNATPHKPYRIGELELYAGKGVGVVTRDGLKPPKGFPAINPVPLEAMERVAAAYADVIGHPVYATVSVTEGKSLAKETANAKVGVVGGISILGTTGWVKPVSSEAYLDSIRAEVAVVAANGYDTVALTIGNTSLAVAKESFEAMQIVEIGNFVYEALSIARDAGLRRAEILCGIGKATKIAQGKRNTHNRFGGIDLEALVVRLTPEIGRRLETDTVRTVKGLVAQLNTEDERKNMHETIRMDAIRETNKWVKPLQTNIRIV